MHSFLFFDPGWDGWMASRTRWTLSLSEVREMVMDREAWHAAIHGVTKSQTWLSDWTELNSLVAQRLKHLPPVQETRVWSLGQEDPLEKEMAIHSSIFAWRIPWTEKPSRLQSTGSQRVGHYLSDFTIYIYMHTHTHTPTHTHIKFKPPLKDPGKRYTFILLLLPSTTKNPGKCLSLSRVKLFVIPWL